MSKKEGEKLKFAIRQQNITVEEFAKMIGYAGRTALNYQFGKEHLDYDLKKKAATALGVTIEELFEQNNSSKDQTHDSEKEALRELATTQKELIKHYKEFITAQMIRQEAFNSIILHRIANVEILVDPEIPKDPENRKHAVDSLLSEVELAVEQKIRELSRQVGLQA